VPTTDPITDLKGEEEMFVQKESMESCENNSVHISPFLEEKVCRGFRILA
jgi:hypothetical protein